MLDAIRKAEILVESLPYIQKLYGKTIVIKYGGNAMINEELKNYVIEDITMLKYIGMNPIIIHGGGPDITSTLNKLNIESKFINGLRVTDKNTMDVVQMVLVGKINKEIVSMLNKKGAKAVGICGLDAKTIECEPLKNNTGNETVDLGYVGNIINIDTKLLETLAKDEYIPVIAPVGTGKNGESYNINADTVASEIAAALKAEKLMILTDVQGVKKSNDSDEIFSALTIEDVNKLIEKGIIKGGMIPKVQGCINALINGVGRTHIIDGRIPHCILLEIFTYRGIGTMIMKKKIPYFDNEVLYTE